MRFCYVLIHGVERVIQGMEDWRPGSHENVGHGGEAIEMVCEVLEQ